MIYKIYLINILYISVDSDELFILDSFARVFTNDFVTNKFYFFWTNFYYLYYFMLLLIILLLSKLVILNQYLIIISCLVLTPFYFCSITEYWFNCFYIININSELLNSLLQNSINKFHPALLYVPLLWLTTTCVYSGKGSFYFIEYWGARSTSFYMLLLLIYTMCLGSWWALQEGSWGGWWNWDPSEVFGLVTILIYLSVVHSLKDFIHKHKFRFYLTIVTSSLLIVYILIQLNFEVVSHNFGTRTNLFINFFSVLLTGLYLINLIALLTYRFNLKASINHNHLLFNRPGFNQILIISVFILLFYSLRVLTLQGTQDNPDTSTLNYSFTTEIIVIYILCVIVSLSWGPYLSSLLAINFIYTTYFLKNFIASIFLHMFIVIKASSLVHKLLLLLLFLITQTYQKSILFSNSSKLWVSKYISFSDLYIYFTKKSFIGTSVNDVSVPGSINGIESLQWFFRFTSKDHTIQLLQDGVFSLGSDVYVYEFGNAILINTVSILLLIALLWKTTISKITY